MTLNPFSRPVRRACKANEHSWIVQQFRGTGRYQNLRICERCGRTHVVLTVAGDTPRVPVHAAAA